jgi:heme A synthase
LQIVFGAVLRHTGERLDAHLAVAALVTLHVVLLAIRVTRQGESAARLRRPALFLFALLLVQLALGGMSYVGKFTTLLRLSSDWVVILTTTHLAVGALMLATAVVLTLRAYRLSAPVRDREPGREVLTEQFSV